MTKHWDLRGMNMAEVMAIAAALDRRLTKWLITPGSSAAITAAPRTK